MHEIKCPECEEIVELGEDNTLILFVDLELEHKCETCGETLNIQLDVKLAR